MHSIWYRRLPTGIFRLLTAAILIALTAAPVIYLTAGSASRAVTGSISLYFASGSSLLFRSVCLDLFAALLTVLFGFLCAMGIWTFFENKASGISAALMLMILIPPFVHVQSWLVVIDGINATIERFTGVQLNYTGIPAVIMSIVFTYLPITSGLCLAAAAGIPRDLADLCRLDVPGIRSYIKAFLPMIYPSLIISGMLVFIINITDYSIPAAFGVNVYALELFARFSAGSDKYSVFISSLPLILICTAIMASFSHYMSKNRFSFGIAGDVNPYRNERFLKPAAISGMIILFFFAAVPLYNIVLMSFKADRLLYELAGSFAEIAYSFAISTLASVLCLIPAYFFALAFYNVRRKAILLAAASLPFIIPSSITGLSLIEMWNTGATGWIYRSPLMPAIGMAARFAFIPAVILTLALMKLDRAYIENIKVYNPDLRALTGCLASLTGRECLASVLIVFALSMSEYGTALLITPPGYQLLTIKIFNYLHYGDNEIVASLCLFVLATVIPAITAAYFLLTGRRSGGGPG